MKGSVVWLHCEAISRNPILAMTWTKDDVPLVQDVPHIRIRRSQNGDVSTSLLVLDGFLSSDSGTYQCRAEDEMRRENGIALTLTGIVNE
jgi:hypothetical protein